MEETDVIHCEAVQRPFEQLNMPKNASIVPVSLHKRRLCEFAGFLHSSDERGAGQTQFTQIWTWRPGCRNLTLNL